MKYINHILIFLFIIIFCLFKKKLNYEHITNNKKNLVFTSVGDNTVFYKNWLKDRNLQNFNLWIVYYGDNENNYNKYKQYSNKIIKRKGSKFQNFHYIYNNYKSELENYDQFFIVDDDIIIDTKDINTMFNNLNKYKLWICQPAYDPTGKNSHKINIKQNNTLLRYTNFIEMGAPFFSKYAIHKFMEFYDPILTGYGTDYLFIWSCGQYNKDKYAVFDSITCRNPYDKEKPDNKRELNKIPNSNELNEWNKIKQKYNLSYY